MSKSLVMNFLNEAGQKNSIKILNIKDGITDAEAKAAMEAIITNNIFQAKGGDLKGIDSAHILDDEITELTVK